MNSLGLLLNPLRDFTRTVVAGMAGSRLCFVDQLANWRLSTLRVLGLVVVFALLLPHPSFAQVGDPPVVFDVPALVPASRLPIPEGQLATGQEQIIEVGIPVSAQIALDSRGDIDEFRFDISWNRNVYPIADYAPKTQTASSIEGTISIDRSRDKNASLNASLIPLLGESISGNAKFDLSNRKNERESFKEIPQHDVLVASGTIHRGTGAFFRFHPSRTETLEGGRELVVAFRVPLSWRGGLLKVECRGHGNRKILGSWKEPISQERAFLVPIYLAGDEAARTAAVEFVRSEQGLKMYWQRHLQSQPEVSVGPFSFLPREPASKPVPDYWVHQLIQSGSDEPLNRYQARLPQEVAEAAASFVAARQSLFEFGRNQPATAAQRLTQK